MAIREEITIYEMFDRIAAQNGLGPIPKDAIRKPPPNNPFDKKVCVEWIVEIANRILVGKYTYHSDELVVVEQEDEESNGNS